MSQTPVFVYVGTYTSGPPQPRGRGEGIYCFRLDSETGSLSPVSITPDVPNPSFLAIHPDGSTLFAANETTSLDGRDGGAVSAYRMDSSTGELTFLNRQPSHGADPCHVRVDGSGRNLLVANYTSGSIALLPVDADGRLNGASDVHQHRGSGPNPDRQEGPHAHFITPDPTNRYVLACDLGLDQVLVYRLDPAAGTLSEHEPAASLPPGSGPRHLAFHPSLPVIYVINELASTISTCAWDGETGTLRVVETIPTLPDGYAGTNSCAEVRVAPSGRFVYGSNRGHDSIAVFTVDPSDGNLSPAGHVGTGGANPRNFTINGSGRFLFAANQDSDTVMTFQIDPDTGNLTPTGQTTRVPSPVCVVIQSPHSR